MTTPSLSSVAHTLDKPTLSLIRRVLCSHAPPSTPLEELLPALTSCPEVDLQLYALLAIVFRDYVYSWYGKITNDHHLAAEIVKVIAHVSREIEERLQQVDLELLLLDEIPALLDTHIKDYRQSQSRLGTSLSPHLTLPQIFHNLQPHPALSSPPSSERLYLKLLSSGILALLLPTSDLESPCERTFIRGILADMVLGSTLDKFSEPWMIYELLTKVLYLTSGKTLPPPPPPPSRKSSRSRNTISEKPPTPPPSPPPPTSTLDTILTVVTHILTYTHTFLISLLRTLHTPPPAPHRAKPLLRMSIFSLIPSYLRLPVLQPWLLGTVLLLAKPFTTRSNRTGAVIDSLLSEAVRNRVQSRYVVEALRMARAAMFPGNGAMGPSRAAPGERERERIRRVAEEAVVDAVPERVRGVWFGREEETKRWVGEVLDVWSEKEANKHLLYNLLDLVVGRVLPELLEVGPAELKRRRVGG